jgi:dTDP-4-amino-4,6-dideoxygalactose transaminase
MKASSAKGYYIRCKESPIWKGVGMTSEAAAVKHQMRKEFLPFARPDVGDAELVQIQEVLENGWLTTGPKTKEFEASFASYVDAKFAVAVNSCTAALHLALEAIGLGAGDEVITTPYTFAATAEVVRYFDAHPVFVDIERDTFNLRPDLLELAVTRRTKAIIPVHIAGLAADLDGVHEIAARTAVPVLEDAAHAFPARYKGRMIGGLSTITCFSFYATKTITTGEGGMICTDDIRLADRCRMMSLHGISRDAWKRYTVEGSWYYEVNEPGYKYNLTDIAAGIGLAQLTRADAMLRRRREIAQQFSRAFAAEPALQVPADREDRQHAWHLYMLRLNSDCLSIDRARFIEELRARNIGASVHFIPLHIQPYYRQKYGYAPSDFPTAYSEYLREVSLPVFSKMTDQDVADVIEAVRDILRIYSR